MLYILAYRHRNQCSCADLQSRDVLIYSMYWEGVCYLAVDGFSEHFRNGHQDSNGGMLIHVFMVRSTGINYGGSHLRH